MCTHISDFLFFFKVIFSVGLFGLCHHPSLHEVGDGWHVAYFSIFIWHWVCQHTSADGKKIKREEDKIDFFHFKNWKKKIVFRINPKIEHEGITCIDLELYFGIYIFSARSDYSPLIPDIDKPWRWLWVKIPANSCKSGTNNHTTFKITLNPLSASLWCSDCTSACWTEFQSVSNHCAVCKEITILLLKMTELQLSLSM